MVIPAAVLATLASNSTPGAEKWANTELRFSNMESIRSFYVCFLSEASSFVLLLHGKGPRSHVTDGLWGSKSHPPTYLPSPQLPYLTEPPTPSHPTPPLGTHQLPLRAFSCRQLFELKDRDYFVKYACVSHCLYRPLDSQFLGCWGGSI